MHFDVHLGPTWENRYCLDYDNDGSHASTASRHIQFCYFERNSFKSNSSGAEFTHSIALHAADGSWHHQLHNQHAIAAIIISSMSIEFASASLQNTATDCTQTEFASPACLSQQLPIFYILFWRTNHVLKTMRWLGFGTPHTSSQLVEPARLVQPQV